MERLTSVFQASAPDIDEIIGGSDEEAADLRTASGRPTEEAVTFSELIQRFKKIWLNEKLSPELMAAQTDTVAVISQEVNKFEERTKALSKGDIRSQLMRMQVERLRYLLADYLRVRMKKIEQYSHYVVTEERSRPQSEEPHLTPAEFNFAKTLNDVTMADLRSAVLEKIPTNFRQMHADAVAFRPNLDSYVFCQVHKRVETAPEDTPGLTLPTTTLMPGEIHLLPYRTIRTHTTSGAVTLL